MTTAADDVALATRRMDVFLGRRLCVRCDCRLEAYTVKEPIGPRRLDEHFSCQDCAVRGVHRAAKAR